MELLREIMPSGKLSYLQMELLKVFNRDLPDEQVIEMRSLLTDYFFRKADEEMESLEKEKGWDANTYNFGLMNIGDVNRLNENCSNGDADYLVTNDGHFNELKKLQFPNVKIISLDDFFELVFKNNFLQQTQIVP